MPPLLRGWGRRRLRLLLLVLLVRLWLNCLLMKQLPGHAPLWVDVLHKGQLLQLSLQKGRFNTHCHSDQERAKQEGTGGKSFNQQVDAAPDAEACTKVLCQYLR